MKKNRSGIGKIWMIKNLICDEDEIFMRNFQERAEEISVRRSIILKGKGSWYKVYLSDILYIETAGKYTRLHTKRGNLEVKKRMKEYEKVLAQKEFVRCHNSYIVNLNYVQEIRGFEAVLETGDCVYISKTRKKAVRECFVNCADNGVI